MSNDAEWQRAFDSILPKLRSGHWDARTTRLFVFHALAAIAPWHKPQGRPVRWLTKRVKELLLAGDTRTVERLRQRIRWCDIPRRGHPGTAPLFEVLEGVSTRPKTEYVFRRDKSCLLAQIERLPPSDQKQFLAAASSYLGRAFRTPKAFFTALGKELEESPDEIEVVRWRIARKDKPKAPLYEMWTFLVDNGAVFEVGKSKPCGVHATQGGFEATDKNAAHRQLAEDLQRRRPF